MAEGRALSDSLFFNGRIHTLAEADSAQAAQRADAAKTAPAGVLAVKNGRIVYAGNSLEQAAGHVSATARRVDLEGATVVPGLNDTHMHFLLQGQRLTEIDIYLKAKPDILRLVAEEAARLEPGRWILGRGWNNEIWPDKAWPCKRELDQAAPRNPVALTRADAHSMWVNSLALEAAGFDRNSPDPPGGEIGRDEAGELTGILVDTPIFKVWEAVPPLSRDERRRAWKMAEAELFSLGITSVGDAWQSMREHEELCALYAAGELRLRVYGMLASVDYEDRPHFCESWRPVRGLFDGRLSLEAVKVVLDGSLGSRSAWLGRDYKDRRGHRGNSRYTDEQLFAMLREPRRAGFRVCAHAIGDEAVRQALRVLERLEQGGMSGPGAGPGSGGESGAEAGRVPLRHRIEHFQTAWPEDIAKALRLKIIPAMQSVHAASDRAMAQARLDAASLAHSYPWRQILDAGGIIANGSDSPMDSANPFHGLHAAVTRRPFDALTPEDAVRLTRREALCSYTAWAAEAEGAQAVKGRLSPGMYADFAVLDRDIFTCSDQELRETQVLTTVLGGEIVHQA